LYEAAKRNLDASLNSHTLPLKSWKEEHEKLAAQRGSFNREHRLLKEVVTEVETIRAQWRILSAMKNGEVRHSVTGIGSWNGKVCIWTGAKAHAHL